MTASGRVAWPESARGEPSVRGTVSRGGQAPSCPRLGIVVPSPTEIFRLDMTPINNGNPGARVAARVIPAVLLSPADPRARWLRPAWWRTIGADSIEIVTWSATTEAEVFYGHVAGDELRGVLRRTSDAIPMDPKTRRIQWDAWPWARATARRVACP